MSYHYLRAEEVISWLQVGRILYANITHDDNFYYGNGFIAKKIAWRFYWLHSVMEES